jgi:hypothetical protein
VAIVPDEAGLECQKDQGNHSASQNNLRRTHPAQVGGEQSTEQRAAEEKNDQIS